MRYSLMDRISLSGSKVIGKRMIESIARTLTKRFTLKLDNVLSLIVLLIPILIGQLMMSGIGPFVNSTTYWIFTLRFACSNTILQENIGEIYYSGSWYYIEEPIYKSSFLCVLNKGFRDTAGKSNKKI